MNLTAAAIVLLALFLLALAATAFAAVRLFASRDAAGRRDPPGCLLGALLGAGLLFLGIVGLIVFAGSLVVLSVAGAIAANPVSRVRVVTAEPVARDALVAPRESAEGLEPLEIDPQRPLHVVFEVRGGRAPVDELVALVGRFGRGEARARVRERTDGQGRAVVIVDVALPVDRNDLREIEAAVRRYLPEARWSDGLLIELGGVRRDW